MTVAKQELWTSNDGKSFGSREEAERHERLQAAQEALKAARQQWVKAVAETQLTADGKPFEWRHWRYFQVVDWYGWPEVREIERPWLHRAQIDSDDVALIIEWRYDQGRGWCRTEHRITDLYVDQKAALAAAHEAQTKRLAELAAQHEESGKKLGRSA